MESHRTPREEGEFVASLAISYLNLITTGTVLSKGYTKQVIYIISTKKIIATVRENAIKW